MQSVSGTTLVLVAFLAFAAGGRLESQATGRTKKPADAPRAKATKPDAKSDKKDDGGTSRWANPDCGPITPAKISDYVRGLQAEAAARSEYEGMLKGLRSQADVVACRNAEAMSQSYQKIMMEGFDGANPPSTAAAIEKQMAKNQAKSEAHMDKKCGKDPSKYTWQDANQKARAAWAKASGMSLACYDWLADATIAFCKLPKDDQKTAAEKGIPVPNSRNWVFTADEAKAIQPHCEQIMVLLKEVNFRLLQ
jgi:hypothetical protein